MLTVQDAADRLLSAQKPEHAYTQSECTDEDPEVHGRIRDALLSHYIEEGKQWHEPRPSHTNFRPNFALAERFRCRDLFQVKVLTHPEHGPLAIGYAGETSTALPPPFSSGYKYLYVMRPDSGEWAICGHYTPCFACMCLGEAPSGGACGSCEGLGWEHLFGIELKTWGTLRESLKLHPPREPAPHQQEYERD